MEGSDAFYLEEACGFVESRVIPEFEDAWERVVGRTPPEYNILVWGSTVTEGREPTDLDVIIEYGGERLGDEREGSIEGILQSRLSPPEFAYVDPIVQSWEDTAGKVANSRCSRVYNVMEDEWEEFE